MSVLSIFLNIQGRSLHAPLVLNGRKATADFCRLWLKRNKIFLRIFWQQRNLRGHWRTTPALESEVAFSVTYSNVVDGGRMLANVGDGLKNLALLDV